METSEAQAAVAEYYSTDNQSFLAALGRLVDALMRSAGDDANTDGIVFGYEDSRAHYFVGHGMAYMLSPQEGVEPISVELHFNPDAKEMSRAAILFGALGPAKFELGARAARNLAEYAAIKARSGKPKVDFDWKYKFSLVESTWSSDLLG